MPMEASNKNSSSLRCLGILKTCTLISTNSRPSARSCRHQLWTKAWFTSAAWMGICMRCSKAGAIGLPLCALLAVAAGAQQQEHAREFWRGIAKHHYEVPTGESATLLAAELSAMLASPDPELRDDLAYSILTHWIYRGNLGADDLHKLADEWIANLKDGLGESGTNSVLKRSFSALCLSSIAERDLKAPF